MHKKLYLFLILIFILPTHFVHSNTNNTIKEDQSTLNILNNYFSEKLLVGKANFQFLFWNMYDAKLITESGKYPSNKFCLLYTSPSPRDRTRSRMPSSA